MTEIEESFAGGQTPASAIPHNSSTLTSSEHPMPPTLPHRQIDPDSLSVEKLLQGSFYEIPKNQREFSWRKAEVEQLLDDLVHCVREDFESGQTRPLGHFLGPVVVIGERNSDPAARQLVIDGQQRLITLTCLFRTLSQKIREHSDESKKEQLSLKVSSCIAHNVAGTNAPRIKLNREDDFYRSAIVDRATEKDQRDFFEKTKLDKPAVRQRIAEAQLLLHERVSTYLDDVGTIGSGERNGAIEKLVYALCDNFYVLKIRADDTRMTYRLFETLNERGLELSQADLVRNVMLESTDTDANKYTIATQRWEDFLDQIDEQQPTKLQPKELIQFSLSSRQDLVRAERLFDEVSKQLRNETLDPVVFAENLAADAFQWADFLRGHQAYWDDETRNSQFFIINVLWKKHAAPLLLRLADRFDKQTKKSELRKSLLAVEAFLLREGSIRSRSIDDLQVVFSDAARIVGDNTRGDAEFVDVLRDASPDAPFIEEFETATASSRLAFYIAWKIERHLSNLAGQEWSPVKQNPSQHLEHILPRKPDSSDWGKIASEEGFSDYLNRLGNHLVLEGAINRTIKNKALNYKISNDKERGYKDSALKLPRELISRKQDWFPTGDWDFSSIRQRQQHLAKNYAAQVWRIVW